MLKRATVAVFCGIVLSVSVIGRADDKVTRVYLLKNSDISDVSRVLNIAIRDINKTRVIGGQGKRLVISDTPDEQDLIAQILPVIDQPTAENDHDKIQMQMLMNAAQYLRRQKIAMRSAPSSSASAAAPASKASPPGGAQSYDKFNPAKPYKSIYASDDAKLLQEQRVIKDDPVILSLSSLQLKGIVKTSNGSPMALLALEATNYTAHDGGLFESNRVRVKNVTSKVLRDRVILTGLDHVPHEITFKSTL